MVFLINLVEISERLLVAHNHKVTLVEHFHFLPQKFTKTFVRNAPSMAKLLA